MSDTTKTLEIFEPLETYFKVLFEANAKLCDDYSSAACIELMDKWGLTDGKISDKNLEAFEAFAVKLKKFDNPVGAYTVKNKFKEIFQKYSVKDPKYVKNVSDDINKLGVDMDDRICEKDGSSKTYASSLQDIYDNNKNSDITGLDIYNLWETDCWEPYSKNKEALDAIKDNLKQDGWEYRILKDFFEIKAGEKTMEIKDYINNKDNYPNARLNAKIEDGKAKIIKLLPTPLRDAFNDYLKSQTTFNDGGVEISPKFVFSNGKYKLILEKDTPIPSADAKFTPEESNVELVLEWVKNRTSELTKGSRPVMPKEEYEPDATPDEEPYYDENLKGWKWDGAFEILNFTDIWRVDKNGGLWKKDTKTKDFVEYTPKDYENDAKVYGEKDLCIYNDPEKCARFFEKMVKGEDVGPLSDIINSDKFVRSYNALKENIVNVNPLFVIGTLKLFGFQKYTEIQADGRKCVKIESFTHWWNRKHHEIYENLNERNKKPYAEYDPMKGVKKVGEYPGSHHGLTPEPPANLELFFKLLIAFINNNEFILNPIDKSIINKAGKPKLNLYGPSKPTMKVDGEVIKNPFHKDASKASKPESLSDLANLMRKNASYSSRPVSMGMNDETLNLSTLLGLMVGITTGGKIRLSRIPGYSTGYGYVGGGEDAGKPDLLPCGAKALEVFTEGVKALTAKGKELDEKTQKELREKIHQLGVLEDEVVDKLKVLAEYVKIINILKDDKKQEVGMEKMKEAIKDYNSSSAKLAQKSDSTIMSILRNLTEDREPTSFYSNL